MCSILLSVSAQFLLKKGMSGALPQQMMTQPLSLRTVAVIVTDTYIVGGFLLYGIGAFVWLWVLSEWEVSKAYPLVGIGFLLTAVIGALLGEQITVLRVAGIIAISAGVWLISIS